jgi:hypothetical protein
VAGGGEIFRACCLKQNICVENEVIFVQQYWFNGFRGEDLNVIFYNQKPNLHNRYKSAERNISQKNPRIYVKLLIVM